MLAPTLLATIYFYAFASDQFVSEARFVVRSRADAPQLSLGTVLSAAVGGGSSTTEAYSVRDFLTSHDAAIRTNEKLNLERIWGRQDVDFLARLHDTDPERLTKYFNSMVSVSFDSSTSVMTLRVRSFTPEDSKAIATTLLTLSEDLINSLSERAREDALRIARHEVEVAERRVLESREALTRFREQEHELDSSGAVQAAVQTMAALEGQLVTSQAELREREAFMRPDNVALRARATGSSAAAADRRRADAAHPGWRRALPATRRLRAADAGREFADRQLASATASLRWPGWRRSGSRCTSRGSLNRTWPSIPSIRGN